MVHCMPQANRHVIPMVNFGQVLCQHLSPPETTSTPHVPSVCKLHLSRENANLVIQVNLDMTDSMGPGNLVRHMQNLLYAYDEYLI